jgi:hypothetical protein
MSDALDQVNALSAERERKKKQRQAVYTSVQRVAAALHKAQCRLSHEDQCSWYDEEDRDDEWTYYAHWDYLDRATALMAAVQGSELLATLAINAIFRVRPAKS